MVVERPRACVVTLCAVVLVSVLVAPNVAAAAGESSPQGNVAPVVTPASGKVAVGAVSAAVDDRIAVLIQNGTTKNARIDLITATATSTDGGSVTRARSVEAFPQFLAPGELALASLKFRRNGAPPSASVFVTVRSTPVSAARASRGLAVTNLTLSAPQTGRVTQTLTAVVQNPTTAWRARAPRVAVMCFGESRQPSTMTTARVGVARLAPGKQATAAVPLATLCPTYLVAVRAT